MAYNLNSSYGMAKAGKGVYTTGKTLYVVGSAYSGLDTLQQLYVPDTEGIARLYSSSTAVTDALAQCVTGRGDVIYIDPSYTAALTAAELLSAETKGVSILGSGAKTESGDLMAYKATTALPQTTQSAIFNVTGKVRIISIIGEVTTAIQNQANNLKLVANGTVGNDTDLCAVLNVANYGVGVSLFITGTLATGMQSTGTTTTSSAGVFQAASLIVHAGTIDLSASASNTGSIKRQVRYQSIDPGARIIAA